MNTLQVDKISKNIRGKQVLSNVSFTATSDHIYALIGANGSGKSMLYRALSGLISIDSGTILFHSDKTDLTKIGIMTDDLSFYPNYTGFKNLKMLAGIRGVVTDEMIRRTMMRVGLDPDNKIKFSKYSLGMKQRLCLAQAVMEEPEFLFLDEPSNGIDQLGMQLLFDIVKDEYKRGALVMISSHDDRIYEHLDCIAYMMRGGCLQKIDRVNEIEE